mmetsp:Transcript_110143/g.310549  ORF Transcript_110143/g.310549 Transcript_110143/m.310549 type:complete len:381 (+) Transcript_110143:72-1214(+)
MRRIVKFCRRRLPTAFVHLVLVESWPIPLTAYLFNKLIIDCHVKVVTRLHGVSLDAFTRYYFEKLTLGHASGFNVTFNDGLAVQLPEVTWGDLEDDWIWTLTAWFFYTMAALLEVSVIMAFFFRGHALRTFEDGAYLHFSWRLSREWWYRTLVGMMALAAVAMPCLWFVQNLLWLSHTSQKFWVNMLVLLEEWYTGVGILLALMKLGAFRFVGCRLRDAPKYWHVRSASECIKEVRLRRRLPEGLIESNAGFGSRLEDALWCADNGDITKLEACLADPDDALSLLERCKQDQRRENEQRLQEMSLRRAGRTEERAREQSAAELAATGSSVEERASDLAAAEVAARATTVETRASEQTVAEVAASSFKPGEGASTPTMAGS